MPVHCFQPVQVPNNYIIAISPSFKLGYTNFSIKSGVDSISCLGFNINTVVVTAATSPPEIRCHMPVSRHGEII